MTRDELMWMSGFMPDWLKRELRPLMKPMVLPPWLSGETEEWRVFRDGTYEASSLGNIRRAKPGIATFVGRQLQPVGGGTGYQQVSLTIDGAQKRFYVHRVIAEAFLGACPGWHIVNHLDGNKTNNAVKNLEYATIKQNAQHALSQLPPRRRGPTKPRKPKRGLQRGDEHWSKRMPERVARGERQGCSKLDTRTVVEIKRRLADGEQQKTLATEFRISVAQMSRIARGLRWGHVHP